MRRGLGGVGLLLAAAAAGCADPYADRPPDSKPAASATSTAASATPTPPASGDAVPPAASPGTAQAAVGADATRSPRSLARAYATLGINWDWRTLTPQLERAQALAVGPLRNDLVLTAELARTDESLRRDRTGSRGRVLSVTAKGAGSTRRVVVVTREQELRDGRATLEGPRTKVYTGTLTRTAAGWRVTDWKLEP